ncbi:efflux transporter outer membrane subunit [Ideonella sp. B7]|uniref:efflux transporter outer membrane subunit n=1 Tax=Ideonella benzenivorans TaxID=2831643 RepID=UPI001CEC5939|nr:efflux transporter outer membrane subunit [Ideonella benzenivorans]MCA6214953.1 efflux transporter outer membrane subunit [Ideonella benzenivorans]
MRLSLAALMAATLVGCAMGPDYQRPEMPTPGVWRTPEPDAAAMADMANLAWWKSFGDSRLDALVQQALENNRDIRIAVGRVREYAARADLAKAQALPEVTARGSSTRDKLSEERQVPLASRTPVNSAAYEIQAQVSWELDLWGRVRRTNEAYIADLMATDEDRRAITLTVVSNVVSTYVQLLALDRELALLQKDVANRQEVARLAEVRQTGGAGTLLQVMQARAAAEEAAAAIPAKEREIAAAENALSILLGSNPSAVGRGRSLAQLTPPPVPQGLPASVLEQRPDVRMAEQNLRAANARIGVAKAEFFPTISLTGLFGYASTDLSRFITEKALFGSVGSQLVFKVFDGGRNDASVRAAEAVQVLHVEAYRRAVQNALMETEDALVYHQKTMEREQALGRQMKAVASLAELARKRYQGGQGTLFEVLDAERQLTAAERLKLDAQRDEHLSLVLIYKALGGGWKVAAPDVLDSVATSPASSPMN